MEGGEDIIVFVVVEVVINDRAERYSTVGR